MADQNRRATSAMRAATILAVANIFSSLLGYARNILISSSFGFGIQTDAYNAAFTVPDTLYTVLVGGGLSAAFIPVFTAYIADKDYKNGFRMGSSVLNFVALVGMVFCIIGIVFAPQYMPAIVNFKKGGPEFFELTILLTRIMFIQCFFMCVTGISQGILESYKSFTPPSVGAVVYNIVIIVTGYGLYKLGFGIMGFSIGVVLGAVANFVIQVVPIIKIGFKYIPTIDFHHPGVKKFFHLFWPVLLGISVQQINLIVNRRFGSTVGPSVMSYMQNAQTIMQLPINIFAISIATSLFPDMVDHYSHGRVNTYKNTVTKGIRSVLYITMPCAAGLVAINTPLIRAMYLQGNVKEKDITDLAILLVCYAVGIVGYSLRQVFLQGFYSVQETKVPVRINIFILTLNMALSYLFMLFWGAIGIALAYAVSGYISMTLLSYFLSRKVGNYVTPKVLSSVTKTCIASAIMFVVTNIMAVTLDKLMPIQSKTVQLIEVMILIGVGGLVYLIASLVLKSEELKTVMDKFLKRYKK